MGDFTSNIDLKPNKLRWYPQQPQRFIFANLSEACCEAKRWKHFSVLQSLRTPSPEPSPEPCWTWPGSAPKPPRPLMGTFGTFSGNSLNLTRHLHQCTPELFWAGNPNSLRCWGKKRWFPLVWWDDPYDQCRGFVWEFGGKLKNPMISNGLATCPN